MTIHAAKGLEFGVTVVAELGRRGNTSVGDLLVDGDRVGLRLSLLDGRSPTPALAYDELKDRRQLAEAQEEERVFYVALTRVRERLILSGGADPTRWPKEGPGAPPLSWLGPALVPDVAERLLEAGAETADTTVGDVRLLLSAPATVGVALREDRLAPGDAGDVPTAPAAPPAAAPPPPAPASAAAEPGPLSYTALASYARCGYRFYAQRVLHLPDVAPPAAAAPAAERTGLNARERGVLVHALIEELDLQAPAAPEPAAVRELAGRLGLQATGADVERARALAGAFAAGEVAARLSAAGAVRREHEFAFELDTTPPTRGPLLTGVVDLLGVEADGGWLVVDAKTDAVRAGADLAAAVDADYGVQRDLYALAALRAGAPRVDVVYAYLARPDEPVTRSYTAADAPALTRRLAALTGRIAAGDFTPTDMPHADLCATCPARDRLCPHPRELKLRR
jgi:ATP-dependent exoDNAse (exonuclease V) beta subunit